MSAVRHLPLHALAEALVRQPHASMEQLAQTIGISRATLHRMVSSRDDLLLKVHLQAIECCSETFTLVGLDHQPVAEVFDALIVTLQPHANLFLFLRQQGSSCRDPEILRRIRSDWIVQRARLEAFFVRGQAHSIFRRDLPAVWLVDTLAALIQAAAEAVHESRLGPEIANRMVRETLWHGIAAPNP